MIDPLTTQPLDVFIHPKKKKAALVLRVGRYVNTSPEELADYCICILLYRCALHENWMYDQSTHYTFHALNKQGWKKV